MRLFARDIQGNIKEWNISPLYVTGQVLIKTGRLDGNLIENAISCNNVDKEIASRISKKRKEGYVSLHDLGITDLQIKASNLIFKDLLNIHLPKYNTDHNNNLKPMKCQKFKEGVMIYPAIAQPKLNGLRCVLRWETWEEGEGMFKQTIEGAKVRTKEGLEYYMPHITNHLNKSLFVNKYFGEISYDGELYAHNMSLNKIKASCPIVNTRGTLSKPSGNPKDIEFHCFDAAVPDILQTDRLILTEELDVELPYIYRVKNILVYSDYQVLKYRDQCIKEGYEGCVVRDPFAEYAFGFRPSFIRKCKIHLDSEFLIIGVIPKPSDASLPLFILKNDLNDETFECNPTGSWEDQRDWMLNSEQLIGMYATVRYRERSGVKCVPFHANVIGIRKTKNEG